MRKLALLLLLTLHLAPLTLEAAQTRTFVLDSARAAAGAWSNGVALFPNGTLAPLPPLRRIAAFDEPLGLALAVSGDGTAYVGTGHPARVWRVRDGKRELAAELAADQVTSLLVAPGGDVYATTAVPALLVKVSPSGTSFEPVAQLAEGNLWDLVWFRGEVLCAAGNPGRLMRLRGGALEVAATVPDRHARCLAVRGDTVLVGTSGKGLILEWDGGAIGVLHDSSFTEIGALAVGPDRTVWAAALTGDPTMGKPPKEGGEATVIATESPAEPGDKGGATSEILRVLPSGAVSTAHRFAKQLAGTVVAGAGGVTIGTGLDGELWQLVEGSAARLDTVDAAQVVRLASGGDWVLTQSPVALWRRTGTPQGSFTSPALDAGQRSRWGELIVQAGLPTGASCTVELRSGVTAEPDETWSAWSPARPCSATGVVARPAARYAQWRVNLAARGAGARVERVVLAYRQINVPPEIKELTVHAPGEVFLKSPPPSDKIIEVQHPDLSGIFTTLDDDAQERQSSLGKKYYRVGTQSVSWKVEDGNSDPLLFAIEIQPLGRDTWWVVRKNLDSTSLAFDTQALADGLYRLRLTASDAGGNPEEPATATAVSGWVTVDNSPPTISLRRDGNDWIVDVADALSVLTLVEWSRDAVEWRPALPVDGLVDGRAERFRIAATPGHHILAVRAIDDHHNRATSAVEEGTP